jgi:hypothetical protein
MSCDIRVAAEAEELSTVTPARSVNRRVRSDSGAQSMSLECLPLWLVNPT